MVESVIMRRSGRFLACLLLITAVALPRQSFSCPFCSAVSLTFSQEIEQSQVAVIAKLVKRPAPGSLAPRAEGPLPKGSFEVVETLKGADLLEAAGHRGRGEKPIETIFLDEKPVGSLFLLLAVEPPELVWSSPIAITEKAVGYLKKLASLPASGPDRLAFFQKHLEDPDEVLARDAYDEFAIASYADLKGLEDRMDASQLLAWIEDPKVQASRRRLYATMLGVCGTKADAARIAKILSGEGLGKKAAEVRAGLDALIACHATLMGAEGLDLVDRLFLDRSSSKDVPFTETYAAVMALRFLGEEKGIVPRERLLRSLRLLLDEPKLADLVIADLARWEDWTVFERLVEIFEKATSDNLFVREPIVNYMRACPKPEAAEAIKRFEKIDPEAVKRAAAVAAFTGAAAVKPKATDGEKDGAPSEIPGAPLAGLPVVAEPLSTEDAADEGRDESLSGRLSPVLGDTDPENRPDHAAKSLTAKKDASSRPFPRVRWFVWAAIVAAVAAVSRAVLRPDSRSG